MMGGVVLKKYLGIMICVILSLTMVACSKKDITTLTYSGQSIEWEATAEYNAGRGCEYIIRYLGNDSKPLKFNYKIEFISGYAGGGYGQYSDTVDKIGGWPLKFENESIIGNINKHRNKKDLYIQIDWNNKTETINLKRDDVA
jgi:hypothetical protein